MRNTLVFLGVIIAGVLTWYGYAFIAALMTDSRVDDCLLSNTVITFFFATGWILPSLTGYDLYKYLHRNELRRERRIEKEIKRIQKNTFSFGEGRYKSSRHDLHKQINLN